MECDTKLTITLFFNVSYAESAPIVGITYFEQLRGAIFCALAFFSILCSLIFFILGKLLQPVCGSRVIVRQPPHFLGYFEIWHLIIFIDCPSHKVCRVSMESTCNFFQAVAPIFNSVAKGKLAKNLYRELCFCA